MPDQVAERAQTHGRIINKRQEVSRETFVTLETQFMRGNQRLINKCHIEQKKPVQRKITKQYSVQIIREYSGRSCYLCARNVYGRIS